MMLRSSFLFVPIRADGLFPAVCTDKDFSYLNSSDPLVKLDALQDAERAFQLYSSCRYLLPENFSLGIEKISSIVGETVGLGNVRRLREDMEDALGLTPPRDNTLPGRIKRRIITALGF